MNSMTSRPSTSRRGIDDGEEDSFQPMAPRRRGAAKSVVFEGKSMQSSSVMPSRTNSESADESRPLPPRRKMSAGATLVNLQANKSATATATTDSTKTGLKKSLSGAKSLDHFSVESEESSVFIFKDDDESSSAFMAANSSVPMKAVTATPPPPLGNSINLKDLLRVDKDAAASQQIGFNWVETSSVSGSTARSEKSFSSNTIAAAGVEPKLRPQTVIYVNGPNNPTRRTSQERLETETSQQYVPPVPEAQLISNHTEVTAPLSAELANHYGGTMHMENEMRDRILRESVHAEVVSHNKQFRTFAKKYWWVFAIFLILAVGISIAVALLVSSPGSGDNENNGADKDLLLSGESNPPTGSPSAQPTTAALFQRYSAFDDVLRPISGDLLDIEDSPQRNALKWLVEQDGVNLIPEKTRKRVIEERYILAVLFFATNGPQWTKQYKFLSDDHFCSWNAETSTNGVEGLNGVVCNASRYVVQLKLGENKLRGTLPPEVGFFSSMTEVDLNLNGIAGTLPSTLGQLTMLNKIDFDFNVFTGTLPSELFEIKTLEILWIDDNDLSGSLPTNIGNAILLDSIAFMENRLTGTVPEDISTLKWMQRLDLDDNNLVGTLPSFEGNTALTALYISSNAFTGTIPSTLGNCITLQNVQCMHNTLNGTIPAEFAALPNLHIVWLNNNTLSGTLPAFESIRTNLEKIDFVYNRLSGGLDTFFASPSNRLTEVDFEGNLLTGSIPETIGMHTSLSYLVLADNQLVGTLPTSLGKLTDVENFFQFYSNQLTGTIPSEFGELKQLRELALSSNQLTGQIPSELGLLTNLKSLYLAANQLTGSLPSEIAALSTLEKMLLYKNEMIGDLGSSLCARVDLLDILGADCLEEVTCTCCTFCCDSNNTCVSL